MSDVDGVSQPLSGEEGWSSRDVRLLVTSQMLILGIVMGTWAYSALMPAFEADPSLAWSSTDTTHMATFANAACMLGLFVAGPMADHFRPSLLLGCNALMVCGGVLLLALFTSAYQAIAIVCAMGFTRGVMWPAAGVLFAANLPSQKQDGAIVASAFGSRLGDVVGPVLVAVSLAMFGLPWRSSLLVIFAVVVLTFAVSVGAAPHLKEPESREHISMQGLLEKTARLVADFDGWLAFISNLGTHAVWALYDYAAVLFADIYHLSPGEAAGANVYMSLGSAVGLAVAFFAASSFGAGGGRTVHVAQSALSVVALLLLSLRHTSVISGHLLLFVVGFGFVAIAYVPCMIYAARSREDERAFRNAVIDGVCSVFGVLFSYMYGTLRTQQGHGGVSKIFAIAAASMGVATVTLAVFYKRLHLQENLGSGSKKAEAQV